MTDVDKGFRIHRAAGGKIPAPRKAQEDFPVTVKQGVQKFQRKDGAKWVTVCTVPDGEQGRKNLTEHYGTVLGRKLGKDFRFVVRAK